MCHQRHVDVRPGLALPVLALLLGLLGCGRGDAEDEVPIEKRVEGGDPDEGRRVIARHGCGTCHVVPGIAGARGIVGPTLESFGRRTHLAGTFPNRPGWLTRWLANPPALDPETAMPDVGLSPDETRDAAAYLYTLR
jgi:cytochrome c